MLIVYLIKIGIVGTSDANELKFYLPELCILLIRFTPNTAVGLINIEGTCVICLLASAICLL